MSTRKIIFSRISLESSIGILAHEKRATQPLHIDAEIEVDIENPVDDEDMHSVLDYRMLHEAIVTECTKGHVNLLETLTDTVTTRLLHTFPAIRQVTVEITKPLAFPDTAGVAIKVTKHR